ncbi:LysR family transcriptional regulator [Corynebacterium sp.]|uniref:LysR family transcriptional regulator n=1 Tax=Corynebacterium sp. TaxID=1720 RepID=UPI003B3AC00E
MTVPVTLTSSQLTVLTGALPVLRELGRGTTLTQTARLQGMSQPALSRMVMRWEAELSVPLLRRVGRGVTLTGEGLALANAATDALSVFESSLEQVLEERDARPVRLGTLRSLSGRIAPLLADAMSRVNLSVAEGSAASLLAQLEAAELDAVIVGPRPTGKNYNWAFLAHQPFHLVVPEGHRLERQASVRLRDVADENFVAMDAHYTTRQFADELCAEAGIAPDVTVESDNSHTLRSFVQAGLGLCILPAVMADATGVASVPIHRVDGIPAMREIGMVRMAGRRLPPHVRSVLHELSTLFEGNARVVRRSHASA